MPCWSCPKEEWLALDVGSAYFLNCAGKGLTYPWQDAVD